MITPENAEELQNEYDSIQDPDQLSWWYIEGWIDVFNNLPCYFEEHHREGYMLTYRLGYDDASGTGVT